MIALRESIEHWERMAAGDARPGETPYAQSCALCILFMHGRSQPERCLGCPVCVKTGLRFCHGSPWREASKNWPVSMDGPTIGFHAAAEVEVEFLKGILKDLEEGKRKVEKRKARKRT